MTELSELNEKGFLAGPNETESDFINRVSYLENPLHFLDKPLLPSLSLKEEGLKINWVRGFFAKKSLFPWEIASTWIYEEGNVFFPLIQLKRKKNTSEEILKHEYIHAARCSFDEKVFEEFLAYRVHKNRLRRFFGPLLRSSKESLFLAAVPLLFPFYFLPSFTAYVCYLTYLVCRLFKGHRTLTLCIHNLKKVCETPLEAEKIIFRLTDFEIRLFSKKDFSEMIPYIQNQTCIRWKQILSSYKLRGIHA